MCFYTFVLCVLNWKFFSVFCLFFFLKNIKKYKVGGYKNSSKSVLARNACTDFPSSLIWNELRVFVLLLFFKNVHYRTYIWHSTIIFPAINCLLLYEFMDTKTKTLRTMKWACNPICWGKNARVDQINFCITGNNVTID